MFFRPSLRVTLFAVLGTVFTVIVQGAMDVALTPLGIPTFTAPFVFVTWLFLLPKTNLEPHPHAPGRGSAGGGHNAKPDTTKPAS